MSVLLVLSSACASLAPEHTGDRLDQHLQACTARYGYDPEDLAALGDHELAPQELAWRACSYRGIRSIVLPVSLVPELYEELIAEDEAMTSGIALGKLTRGERSDRLTARLEAIGREEGQRRLVRDEQQRRYLQREIELMQNDYGPQLLISNRALQRLSR